MFDDRNIFEVFGIDETLSDDQLTEMITKSPGMTYYDMDVDYGFYLSLSELCGTEVKLLLKIDRSDFHSEYASDNLYNTEQVYESEEYYIILDIYIKYHGLSSVDPLGHVGIGCTRDLLEYLKLIKKDGTEEQIIEMCNYDSINDAKKYFSAFSNGDIDKANRMLSEYLRRQTITEEDTDSDENDNDNVINDDYLNNNNKNITDHIYE